MQSIEDLFKHAKQAYDRDDNAIEDCIALTQACLKKLKTDATLVKYGDFSGDIRVEYWIAKNKSNMSRPYRPDLFLSSPSAFTKLANTVVSLISNRKYDPKDLDKFVYTSVISFCLCYDIWKPKSRKTPGTYFEVLIGTISKLVFPKYTFSKHIKIVSSEDIKDFPIDIDDAEDTEEAFSGNSVSTDLVIINEKIGKGAIIPLKITTRERIVQPFAHQRILDSAYPDKFKSFLACVSEVQGDDKTESVKQICVPGTVALFQKHLAKLGGLYYCDVPHRYNRNDIKSVIDVRTFYSLFTDVADWLNGK